jgi:hypothetical protein
MRLRALRTLGQAVNRSGRHNVLVVENDDALFQPSGPAIWYGVQVLEDLTTRKYGEPVDEGHQVWQTSNGSCAKRAISPLPKERGVHRCQTHRNGDYT